MEHDSKRRLKNVVDALDCVLERAQGLLNTRTGITSRATRISDGAQSISDAPICRSFDDDIEEILCFPSFTYGADCNKRDIPYKAVEYPENTQKYHLTQQETTGNWTTDFTTPSDCSFNIDDWSDGAESEEEDGGNNSGYEIEAEDEDEEISLDLLYDKLEAASYRSNVATRYEQYEADLLRRKKEEMPTDPMDLRVFPTRLVTTVPITTLCNKKNRREHLAVASAASRGIAVDYSSNRRRRTDPVKRWEQYQTYWKTDSYASGRVHMFHWRVDQTDTSGDDDGGT